MKPPEYCVYILHCADGTLYTGIAKDLEQRINAHNEGKGAKYTQSRLPVKLVYQEELPNKSAALKREIQIKQKTRAAKLKLITVLK